MLRLEAFHSDKVWGYERWIVSTMENGPSLAHISDTETKQLKDVIGGAFRMLIKVIQADDTLSVQVHPDDDYAQRVENTSGKTECWYVLDAREGARLVSGINGEYSRSDIEKSVHEKRLDQLLSYETVKAGDFIFIPAGTVHAIGGGLRLLEVQQPSDVTYRLYDWGRPREIHVQKSLDTLRCVSAEPVHSFSGRFSCPYFNLEKVQIEQSGTISFPPDTDSEEQWNCLFILDGEAEITDGSGKIFIAVKEDVFLVKKNEALSVKTERASCMKIW